ncbi:MAG: hypothetical protein HOP11_00755 [Saprospiraceae bacterium]|nr:hypothetical protein [Saprospiraceae bacterium]
MKKYLICLLIGLNYYCSQLNAQSVQLETMVLVLLATLNLAQCTFGHLPHLDQELTLFKDIKLIMLVHDNQSDSFSMQLNSKYYRKKYVFFYEIGN